MSEKKHVRVESADYRPDGTYKSVLQNIESDGVCPFCAEQLATYHKKPILHEGKSWLLTENMYPYENSSVHLLVIHKSHIEHMSELTAESWSELRDITVTELRRRGILGATFMMRFGDTRFNGASVNHLHAQVIAGSGDKDAKPILTRVG